MCKFSSPSLLHLFILLYDGLLNKASSPLNIASLAFVKNKNRGFSFSFLKVEPLFSSPFCCCQALSVSFLAQVLSFPKKESVF